MKKDQVITMFYELKDAKTGEVLESNMHSGEPVSFITGKNQVLNKLEEALSELESGAKTKVEIACADALGEYDESAVQQVPIEQFAGIELKEGMELFGQGEDGATVRVTVKAIGENEVMIDFNHPYAGKDLIFDIEIAESRPATEDELLSGMVGGAHSCGCGGHGHDHDHDHHHHHHGGGGCCGGGGHKHGGGGCGCGGHGHHH